MLELVIIAFNIMQSDLPQSFGGGCDGGSQLQTVIDLEDGEDGFLESEHGKLNI